MASREFVRLLERLSRQVSDADMFGPSQRNEQWTKANFILPLLEGLGWDRFRDVGYEDSPQDVEGWLDYVLRCQPSIGIEAKALDVRPPENRDHPQVVKGLRQSEDRGASYFIWTNGDCWEFFSLALPGAPIFKLTLSDVRGDHEQIEHIASQFDFIDAGSFPANPKLFDEAIRENWKAAALPATLDTLITERMGDLLELVRRDLPSELDITDEEILTFFKALKPPTVSDVPAKKGMRQSQKTLSFPEDWQQLVVSYEPKYEGARRRLREGYYRKLAQYLIGNQYSPWSKETTWRHVGTSRDAGDRKKLGPVVALFIEWRFIEEAEGARKYQRVEASVPYLRELLEEPGNL